MGDAIQTTPDVLAFLFSLIGGFSMGSYPVPIKAPSVLKACVHPMIFQCYKSFWVFVLGFTFIILNLIRDKPAYVFTYWGLLGAAAWIPSGLGTIAAVPRLGVGMAMVINTGMSATFQFVAGQCVGETMKKHQFGSTEIVFAPFFLVCVVMGLMGLVLSQHLECPQRCIQRQRGAELSTLVPPTASEGEGRMQPGTGHTQRRKDLMIGLSCAVAAGIFSALQFALISIGKKVESAKFSCTDCPEKLHFTEEFDAFGSYMTSFGIGAGVMTALYLSLFVSTEKCKGNEMPQSHFGLLRILGSIAGWCWVVGNVFQSAAVNRGGSSVMGPANQALQLITSGIWGLLYYKEVKDPKRIACWVASAAWTVVFVILLGREKQT